MTVEIPKPVIVPTAEATIVSRVIQKISMIIKVWITL